MAMPKKGSRSLVVDGRKYRWCVRRTEDDTAWNAYGMQATLTVAVEDFYYPQSMLCISYECGFPYGKASARPRWVDTGQVMEVTPQRVAALIREALKQGWDPQAQTADFKLDLFHRRTKATPLSDAFRQVSSSQ